MRRIGYNHEKELRKVIAAAGSLVHLQTPKEEEMVQRVIRAHRETKRGNRR